MSFSECAKCGNVFSAEAVFDLHHDVDYDRVPAVQCLEPGEYGFQRDDRGVWSVPAGYVRPLLPGMVRGVRRTCVVKIGADTVRLCEPECRNEVLTDLGVPGGRGGWVYPASGSALVTVGWSGKTLPVSWARRRPSALRCDMCEFQWQRRIPRLVERAREQSEAMKGTVPLFGAA